MNKSAKIEVIFLAAFVSLAIILLTFNKPTITGTAIADFSESTPPDVIEVCQNDIQTAHQQCFKQQLGICGASLEIKITKTINNRLIFSLTDTINDENYCTNIADILTTEIEKSTSDQERTTTISCLFTCYKFIA